MTNPSNVETFLLRIFQLIVQNIRAKALYEARYVTNPLLSCKPRSPRNAKILPVGKGLSNQIFYIEYWHQANFRIKWIRIRLCYFSLFLIHHLLKDKSSTFLLDFIGMILDRGNEEKY